MPEMHALATYYARQGGTLFVAEADGALVGMIAARPMDAGCWEICRVYVAPALHGSGLGHALLDLAEGHAIAAGAARLALWSDTRFDRAHRFYEKRSYVRSGPVRVLHDISNSLEFSYAKPVDGVAVLDIAAASSAEGRLAEILLACVAAGDAVGFRPPVPRERAVAFWHRVANGVGSAERAVVAAWRAGVMVGAGVLDLATPEDQPHLAEIRTILVHPSARRGGIGQQVLQVLEQAARVAGRSLLTLGTPAGDAEEALCRADGWQEAGRIPGGVMGVDGGRRDRVLFWKAIAAA
jgi:GNAT superfamily N-acetyltransferase